MAEHPEQRFVTVPITVLGDLTQQVGTARLSERVVAEIDESTVLGFILRPDQVSHGLAAITISHGAPASARRPLIARLLAYEHVGQTVSFVSAERVLIAGSLTSVEHGGYGLDGTVRLQIRGAAGWLWTGRVDPDTEIEITDTGEEAVSA